MAQIVEIKLKKNELKITLNEKYEYKDIIKSLKKKIPDLKKLYKDDKTPIFVTGKVLKNKEIDEVKDLIQKEIDVQIDFDSPKVLGLYGIKKAYDQEIGESPTIYHKGSIRSGQKIENEGSIVIIGDINSGAEVIAGENIVVVGRIMGLAHAGAKGNKKAIIAAERIETPQIRISNIVKSIQKEAEEYSVRYTFAYVKEDKIELE